MILDCAGKPLDLSVPRVMGILNVTPDSFSDGGRFIAPAMAVARARQMVAEGAAIIDIGGESTRPGAAAVTVEEEIARVVPVIEALAAELPVPISVDTSKPEVMRAAVAAGAGLINDVYALRLPGALAAAAELGVPVCLMHMQGEPRTMQQAPQYVDVVAEVRDFLAQRVADCIAAGIARERILLDPGFGFGKTLAHNLSLLKHLPLLQELGLPLLVGMSRKSMIGAVLDAPVGERVYGSVAAHALALWLGAAVVRVHDVKATVDALKLVQAVRQAG
ncbi:dihydropteroate synthase [Sulfurivermis fontis]|uniref:dihydropteroate synthase n=1 Tax=Sulfurivermis fontis TaxID=1972068 RepID=UPI000FDAD0DB|nr:dihydropteroate synthase [Sulfurivermis fontis]